MCVVLSNPTTSTLLCEVCLRDGLTCLICRCLCSYLLDVFCSLCVCVCVCLCVVYVCWCLISLLILLYV